MELKKGSTDISRGVRPTLAGCRQANRVGHSSAISVWIASCFAEQDSRAADGQTGLAVVALSQFRSKKRMKSSILRPIFFRNRAAADCAGSLIISRILKNGEKHEKNEGPDRLSFRRFCKHVEKTLQKRRKKRRKYVNYPSKEP